jgi:hypothetical protein
VGKQSCKYKVGDIVVMTNVTPGTYGTGRVRGSTIVRFIGSIGEVKRVRKGATYPYVVTFTYKTGTQRNWNVKQDEIELMFSL